MFYANIISNTILYNIIKTHLIYDLYYIWCIKCEKGLHKHSIREEAPHCKEKGCARSQSSRFPNR